jgi:uncharacterized phage-associated protein
MIHRFDTTKTVQAAAALLRFEPSWRMSRLRLLKLLYIADRECLKETGRPIIGHRVVAMDHGPLHSAVYDLIKGQRSDENLWSSFIRNTDHRDLVLCADPGAARMSRYELAKLEDVSARFAEQDDFSLSLRTHEFDEWKKNFHPGTSTPIPLRDIIAAVGRSEDAEEIEQDLKDSETFANVFGG